MDPELAVALTSRRARAEGLMYGRFPIGHPMIKVSPPDPPWDAETLFRVLYDPTTMVDSPPVDMFMRSIGLVSDAV